MKIRAALLASSLLLALPVAGIATASSAGAAEAAEVAADPFPLSAGDPRYVFVRFDSVRCAYVGVLGRPGPYTCK